MEMDRCQQYIDALEEERRKIQVFQRELPLCVQLVTQAIEACRQRLATEITGALSESEETSSEGPVLEEFIPIKKESDNTLKQNQKEEDNKDYGSNDKEEKPDWLRSVQLWSQDSEALPREDVDSCRKSLSSGNKTSGAFHPFCKEKRPASVTVTNASAPVTAAPSSTTRADEKEVQSQKKRRRCWSLELHQRFLHALQQLGGSHAATPKQIRELMKVDGLTNDEVKSHLQKYRLHARRVPSTASIRMSNSQPPHFVVVGGFWVPPEYAAVASSGQAPEAAPTTVYAPVETTPAPSVATEASVPDLMTKLKKQSQQQPPARLLSSSGRRGGDKSGSWEENSIGDDASSSATSSSHTTTSPVL